MASDDSTIANEAFTAILNKYSHEADDLVSSQANSVLQKFSEAVSPLEAKTHNYHDSVEFWNDCLSSSCTFGRGSRIRFTTFSVTDWIPRWPGLYTTERARRARRQARNMIFSENDSEISNWKNRDPALYKRFGGAPILRPGGKQKMLSGGTGCVRLAAYSDGGKYLCNAFTGAIPECGVPIELSQAQYDSLADEITNRGSASGVTVTGTLRDTPAFLRDAYPKKIRRFILSDVEIERVPDDYIEPTVSVPISFIDASDKVLVSFASFSGADPSGYIAAVEFLNEVYVKTMHDGNVLTDFDETQSNFDDAIFSLKNISSGRLDEAHKIRRMLGEGLDETLVYIENYKEFVEKKVMGNNYTNTGVVGAMGDNAAAVDSSFTQSNALNISPDEFTQLAEELGTLKKQLIADGSANAIVAAGTIATAEESARKNDDSGVVDALKNCGSWVLDVATKIGVALVVAAIKKSSGL